MSRLFLKYTPLLLVIASASVVPVPTVSVPEISALFSVALLAMLPESAPPTMVPALVTVPCSVMPLKSVVDRTTLVPLAYTSAL